MLLGYSLQISFFVEERLHISLHHVFSTEAERKGCALPASSSALRLRPSLITIPCDIFTPTDGLSSSREHLGVDGGFILSFGTCRLEVSFTYMDLYTLGMQ